METPKGEQVRVTYVRSPNFRVAGVTGLHGAPNGYGDVYVELYVEHPTTPSTSLIEVDASGAPQSESRVQESEWTREVEIGLLIKPEAAEMIAKMLLDVAVAATKNPTR